MDQNISLDLDGENNLFAHEKNLFHFFRKDNIKKYLKIFQEEL